MCFLLERAVFIYMEINVPCRHFKVKYILDHGEHVLVHFHRQFPNGEQDVFHFHIGWVTV